MDTAHSECAPHGRQLSSMPQIGVVAMHALGCAVVHCTHLCVAVSQTPWRQATAGQDMLLSEPLVCVTEVGTLPKIGSFRT